MRVWPRRRLRPEVVITSLFLLVAGACVFAETAIAQDLGVTSPTNNAASSSVAMGANLPVASPFGVSAYEGGNNQTTLFSLPLARSDSLHDTVIHLANSTGSTTTAALTFFNSDGSVFATTSQVLSPWASYDFDIGQVYQSSFDGSVAIAASPTGIAVSADVINETIPQDNLASYAGIKAGARSVVVPTAYVNHNDFNSSVYAENISAQTATLLVTYNAPSIGVVTTTLTVPPNGRSIIVPVRMVGAGQSGIGTLSIQSDQKIAVESMTYGPSGYESTPSFNLSTLATGSPEPIKLPWFDSSDGDSSAMYYYNGSTVPANVTLTLFGSNGSAFSTVSKTTSPGSLWSLSPLSQYVGNSVNGSAVFQSDQPAGLAIVVHQVPSGGYASYGETPAQPVDQWSDLPGLRKDANGESTGFAVMNNQSVPQTYQITYRAGDGSLVKSDSLTLAPNASWFYSQACDRGLPSGFAGSAELVNALNGPPPLAVAELYAGYSAPSTTGATNCGLSPTPTPTSTSTSVPTATPIILAGSPTVVTANFGDVTVRIDVPIESPPIARIAVSALSPAPAITPTSSQYQQVFACEVAAWDANGNAIRELSAPLTIAMTPGSFSRVNPLLAQLYTVGASDNSEALLTNVTANNDGTYTATAQTSHLSPVFMFAPRFGASVPQVYLPLALNRASGW